mmetsp:Transcript_58458/g.79701  ORF Transcript_58458/g.79701 Transcript_58458/m.79701 type:complete len:262 (-) Transcript_58458:421-1206(-)
MKTSSCRRSPSDVTGSSAIKPFCKPPPPLSSSPSATTQATAVLKTRARSSSGKSASTAAHSSAFSGQTSSRSEANHAPPSSRQPMAPDWLHAPTSHDRDASYTVPLPQDLPPISLLTAPLALGGKFSTVPLSLFGLAQDEIRGQEIVQAAGVEGRPATVDEALEPEGPQRCGFLYPMLPLLVSLLVGVVPFVCCSAVLAIAARRAKELEPARCPIPFCVIAATAEEHFPERHVAVCRRQHVSIRVEAQYRCVGQIQVFSRS